jgi:serine/threonine protein kinase
MSATASVEDICQRIEAYKLLSTSQYAAMRGRWFTADRKNADDVEQFKKWLVLNRYVTEFVAKVLSGRKSDQLVLNQYRLQDQLHSGPMAGSYLALDPLDRPVAIEVLSAASAANAAVLNQFQQAALKAIKVVHPNVGRILDVGEAQGFYFLVKEIFEGQTVEEILEKRGKLGYIQATRLMALALSGLEALHAAGVPAGDLSADCLLLAPAGKDTPSQRTVKILHAGVRRRLFDEAAIGHTIKQSFTIPDELELMSSTTFTVSDQVQIDPVDDLFRLGCIFYQAVTGKAPYAARDLPKPTAPARPVNELAPEVPEMLCQIIQEMIDPDSSRRPQKAANVAKALRVFLAAEEHAKETKVEEQLVAPTPRAAARVSEEAADEEVEEEDETQEEEDEAPARPRAAATGVVGKATALWEEINPQTRDIVFFGSGAILMLALIFIAHVLTGFHLGYIAGLATGIAGSYFADRWLQRRQQQRELAAE